MAQRCVTVLILFRLRILYRHQSMKTSVVQVPLPIPIVFFGVGFALSTAFDICAITVLLVITAMIAYYFLFCHVQTTSPRIRKINCRNRATMIAQILWNSMPTLEKKKSRISHDRVQSSEMR
ncbi:hypothetical protein M3Y98_00596400 [Aphelenchoides besseyi]|nr:hypothetical protein M3Y98_00596400 [Aphelenchoides besseyi]KAI6194027.1 hypothetical protein M3Y96_01081400 [Aphelenchoides besseyi]